MKEPVFYKYTVHKILAHSYTVYLMLLLVGVALDIVFHYEIFPNAVLVPLGAGILLLATILIFWAQLTSRNLERENVTKESFCKGPYCYTRMPTHFGLLLLLLGFGIIANAFFVVLTTLISFLVTKFVFLRAEEKVLEHKYGTPYAEYKKAVKL